MSTISETLKLRRVRMTHRSNRRKAELAIRIVTRGMNGVLRGDDGDEGKKLKIHVEQTLIDDIFRIANPVLYCIKTSGCCKYLTQLTTNTWLTATANKIIIEQNNR
ncbi:hypothetical protein PRIPAC_94122 [Pristionchus pacificus]|uniref:Uncharacterized protein n=1 Tax=Pristionchus pacificus TaxID=54126 RepID=A0A2A6CD85_PRIPA|nr:hypothetical protein PRIPAC_94122 [Pristionchus pacificus]|eukprot:PDM76162.1 hypothetical protein PRIPAC_39766 [Pristionchus pacificus]